jgi:hypothetical protein
VPYSKVTALKVINLLLAVVAIVQLSTAVCLTFIPESTERIVPIHMAVGFALFVLLLLHIFLNWSWIKSNFFKKKR